MAIKRMNFYRKLMALGLLFFCFISNPSWAGDCVKAQELSEEATRYISKDPARAEEKLREAVNLCSNSASLHYNLGLSYYRQGKHSDAESELKEAVDLNKDYPKALNALAFIYLTKNEKISSATELAERAVELEPRNSEFKDTLRQLVSRNPPKLKVEASIEDQTGNRVLEAAESGVLKVKISNKGQGAARKVTITPGIANSFPGVLIGGESTISRVEPNAERILSFNVRTDEDTLRTGMATVNVSVSEQFDYIPLPTVVTIKTEAAIDKPPLMMQNRPDAIAVVIGNKDYRKTMPVDYAIHDAAIMKEYLEKSLGFREVYFIENAELSDLIDWFGDDKHTGKLYDVAKNNRSEIFIYYSGHGAPDTQDKTAFLVPVSADPQSIRRTGYSLDTLYLNLSKISSEKNPKSIVVVLDACFSGDSAKGKIIKYASPLFIEPVSPILNAKKTVVFTSSKADQVSSWYMEKKHGLFTYFFLKSLREGLEEGKQLTAEDIDKSLNDSDGVNDTARKLYSRTQNPQIKGDKSVILIPKK